MGIVAGSLTIKAEQQKVNAPKEGAGVFATIYAKESNAATVWVGGKTETVEKEKAFPLAAGQSIQVMVKDLNQLWCIGTASDVIYFLIGNTL